MPHQLFENFNKGPLPERPKSSEQKTNDIVQGTTCIVDYDRENDDDNEPLYDVLQEQQVELEESIFADTIGGREAPEYIIG